ncbi:hypothetical protein WJX77_003597 [Trebouxia sp. C0004]
MVTDGKKPILFLLADQDRHIPEELRHTIDGIISKKPFPTKVKFYPGCDHGWSLRRMILTQKLRKKQQMLPQRLCRGSMHMASEESDHHDSCACQWDTQG